MDLKRKWFQLSLKQSFITCFRENTSDGGFDDIKITSIKIIESTGEYHFLELLIDEVMTLMLKYRIRNQYQLSPRYLHNQLILNQFPKD